MNLWTALCRARNPLDEFDPDDGRYDHILEAVIGFAEIFLHGLRIQPPSDLIGGCDHELVARNLNEAPALKFVLEQFALGLCAFQDGVGVTERVSKRFVGEIVKAGGGYGREAVSLGHG